MKVENNEINYQVKVAVMTKEVVPIILTIVMIAQGTTTIPMVVSSILMIYMVKDDIPKSRMNNEKVILHS